MKKGVQSNSPSPSPSLFRDRFLIGLLVLLTKILERVSIDRSVAFGACLGRLWVRLGGPRTRRVREQLILAFPERENEQREEWTRDVFVHLGRGLAELILLRGRLRAGLLDRVRVEGLEHVAAAERANSSRGALIVTAHCGNWEVACAKVAAMGIPISVVYRPLARPLLDRVMLDLRAQKSAASVSSAAIDQIPMGRAGIRVVRAWQAGRKVLVLLDQNARREEGVFVSFFGRPACTRYGPIALAGQRGVPVLLAFIRRDADGRGHRLQIQPALQLEVGDSDDEAILRRNVQTVTATIEKEIRESPDQWIWTHRRWRTQPAPSQRDAAVN